MAKRKKPPTDNDTKPSTKKMTSAETLAEILKHPEKYRTIKATGVRPIAPEPVVEEPDKDRLIAKLAQEKSNLFVRATYLENMVEELQGENDRLKKLLDRYEDDVETEVVRPRYEDD